MGEYKRIKKTCRGNHCNLNFKIIAWNLFLSSTKRPKLFVRENVKLDHHMQLSSDGSNLSIKSSNDISKQPSLWGFIKRLHSKITNSNIVNNLLFLFSEDKNVFDPSCAKIRKCYNIHNWAYQLNFKRHRTNLFPRIWYC